MRLTNATYQRGRDYTGIAIANAYEATERSRLQLPVLSGQAWVTGLKGQQAAKMTGSYDGLDALKASN